MLCSRGGGGIVARSILLIATLLRYREGVNVKRADDDDQPEPFFDATVHCQ